LVHGGVAAVRDDALDVLELVVLVPHLPAVADHARHGGVDDDVGRHVQVGDPFVAVDHGQPRPLLVHLLDVVQQLLARDLREQLHLVVKVLQAVVGVKPDLLEHRVLVPFAGEGEERGGM